MNPAINTETAAEILNQLVNHHYYANRIRSLISEAAVIVNYNEQLQHLLKSVADRSNFSLTHEINWSQLTKKEQKIMDSYFDYLYFTSPQFLKGVL